MDFKCMILSVLMLILSISLSAQKNDILTVPSRSVYSIDTQKYVKLVDTKNSDKIIETKVETGMRGIDGYVEIISGLNEGDKIVASPNV